MAKIITVTINTALDLFIEVDGLEAGDNIQARRCTEFACGKGINVAKAIESLNHSVLCLGFAGRQSMPLYDALNSERLQTDLMAVDGKTRTNITLLDSHNSKEIHIRTGGFTVTSGDCRKLVEKLETYMTAGDIVIFSGSLPPGAPTDGYRSLIERCHAHKATPILDTSGQSLAEGLCAEPYLIKPNQQELEEIVGEILPDERAIITSARSLLRHGSQWLYLSRGRLGVIAVSQTGAWSASVQKDAEAMVSSIGCGDAMVAGLAVATLEQRELEETIKLGVACGFANLYSKEPGRLDRVRLSDALNAIVITALE